jgi:hypothetical protein
MMRTATDSTGYAEAPGSSRRRDQDQDEGKICLPGFSLHILLLVTLPAGQKALLAVVQQ